jgi:hypothetical protein
MVGRGKMPKAHDRIEVLTWDRTPRFNAHRTTRHLLFEIETRREGCARARNNQRSHTGILFDLVKSRTDLTEHGCIECVGAFGAAQCEAGDRTDFLDCNCSKALSHVTGPY